MTAKSTPLAFQPAPRPQPRVSAEQRVELAEAAHDLGFGRTTSSPTVEPDHEAAAPTPKVAAATTAPVRRAPKTEEASAKVGVGSPSTQAAATRNAVLKFDIPEALWVALRHEAVNRRATVKYLILEALSEKGYPIDLAAIPEDGRRQR